MIIINANNKKLQIVSTVSDLHWTASWETGGTCSDHEDQGLTINGTTDVLQGFAEIEYISVYNNTLSSSTITIQIEKSGTPIILIKILLAPGFHLIYNEDSGWATYDSNGSVTTSGQTISGDGTIYGVASGINAYASTISGVSAYVEGLSMVMRFTNANTGASTININSMGAKNLVNFGGDALVGTPNADIKAGQIHDITYDGANFQIKTVTCNIVNAI